MTETRTKLHLDHKSAWSLGVFLLLCFYMLWPVNFYLAQTLKTTYYMLLVPVLVSGVLYFRRFQDGLEYKLLLGFWLWYTLTRILNNNFALAYDFHFVFDLALMVPFFALGLSQSSVERGRFLDWLSAAVGGYHFVVGLIALWAFLNRTIVINPITEGSLGIVAEYSYARINVFDTHPNVTGFWFLMALFLMIYEFFACRKKLWRVPILLSAAVDLAVIAVSYSRSVRVSMALALALLAAALLFQGLRGRSRWLRAAVVVVGMTVVAWTAYEGSALCADVIATVSYRINDTQPMGEAVAEAVASEEEAYAGTTQTGKRSAVKAAALSIRATMPAASAEKLSSGGLVHSDPRPKSGSLEDVSSGRLYIWRSAFQALRVDPSVLWKGNLVKDTMTIANTFTDPALTGGEAVHYHNSLLQILMTTGIPGLLLALAFLALLVYHSLRLLFCADRSVTTAIRTLALPVIASIPHFMLEAGLFTTCDVRTLFFFLMCGLALGAEREIGKEE